MIRAHLHPDRHTVRLDVTDAAERLLDEVAVAFVEDEQHVAALLRELAAAAGHARSRAADPDAPDHVVDHARGARDAVRERIRRSLRASLHRARSGVAGLLPALDELLAVDLTYRRALDLGEQLGELALETVAGRRAAERQVRP
ncbi:hypothetical protein [Kitasatospora phosalacinea]|uniref:Uncharacterized protein n=1 Tax=Kitasatospora phosalacinea TaxID=2065 RepID=A0A9W6PF38_9ACTN|nr:hypothetical protein [Kitasatospora phosalacinea]GLW53946.1 hypothetical protein Kpho01_19570 [Kitasatospora phosalacinea]